MPYGGAQQHSRTYPDFLIHLMSNETAEQEGQASKGKKLLPVALIGLVGAAIGGGMGTFLVGPTLVSKPAHAAEQTHGGDDEHGADGEDAEHGEDEESDDADSSHGEKGGHGEGASGEMYLIDNIVLNPAGSGGTRFLMLSLALDLKAAETAEKIRAREPEVRDAVLRVLGSKTVEQLADMAARDSLKSELRDEIGSMVGKRAVRRVYLPQFVIQ